MELLPTVVAAGLDKTGTLTTGEFGVRVQEKFSNSSFNADVMKLAAALEMKSAHPIAAAIVSEAMGCIGEANEHGELPEVKGFRVVDGVGIKGRVRVESSFVHVFVGNKRVLDAVNATPVEHAKFTNFQQQYPNDTTVAVVVNKELRLGLALNDTIREDAAQMVEELYDLGCDPRIFTGDAELSGKTVAAAVGIDPDICHFSMKPEDKYQLIRELEAELCQQEIKAVSLQALSNNKPNHEESDIRVLMGLGRDKGRSSESPGGKAFVDAGRRHQ